MLSLPRAIRQATAGGRATVAIVRYNSTSTMHDNDPELLEREKQRNLSNIQHKTSTPLDYAPGWNESLATASEAHVKADQYTGTPADLQRLTVEYVHARHSPDDRLGSRESHHERDEVSGPLSTKGHIDDLQTRTVQDIHSEEFDEVPGRKGKGGKRLRRTVTKEETISEQHVKADRGQI